MKTRTEHDLLGSLEVPADAYCGIHTMRTCENFDISGLPIHPELIRSLALVKKACAIAREALESGKTIRQLALEKKLFTKKQLDTILSPIEMTHPGIAGLGEMGDGGNG